MRARSVRSGPEPGHSFPWPISTLTTIAAASTAGPSNGTPRVGRSVTCSNGPVAESTKVTATHARSTHHAGRSALRNDQALRVRSLWSVIASQPRAEVVRGADEVRPE